MISLTLAKQAKSAGKQFKGQIFTRATYNTYRAQTVLTTPCLETLLNNGIVYQIQIMANPRQPRNFFFFASKWT